MGGLVVFKQMRNIRAYHNYMELEEAMVDNLGHAMLDIRQSQAELYMLLAGYTDDINGLLLAIEGADSRMETHYHQSVNIKGHYLLPDTYQKISVLNQPLKDSFNEYKEKVSVVITTADAVQRQNYQKDTLLFVNKIYELQQRIHQLIFDDLRVFRQKETSAVNHAIEVAILTFIGGLILSVIIVIFTLRAIIRPVAQLAQGTARISEGDLNYRIPITSRDELGRLANAFNLMTENLKMTTVSRDYAERKAAELEKAYRDLEVLKEELQHRVNDLNMFFEIDRQISSKLHVSEILEYVIKSVPKTMEAEICAVFLWDEIKERLIPNAVTGLSLEELQDIPFLPGEGLEGWVGLEKKLANVQDVSKDARWKDKLPYPVDKVKTALFCPILMGERLLGVIGLINKGRERVFNHSDEALLIAIAGQLAVAMENAILYERVRDLSLGTIRSLAKAIDARDPYTRGHSEDVAKYAVMIANALNFSQEGIQMMEIAGLLHDTGKIGIPGEILNKAGSLTPEEWDKIKVHPYLSRQILLPVKSLHKTLSWIYHHHEKLDGQGYPDGISGEKIPLEAKILAVADTFSALISNRPYRKARTKEEAIEEIRRVAGTQLDPEIVEVFINALRPKNEKEGGV